MTASAAPRLWLARHARPIVDQGICYGRLDVAADPAASRAAAHALVRARPAPWAAIRHSPLQRCELLAQDLQALQPDWASKSDTRLAELDFGNWEGRAWSGIARDDIDAWTADFCDHRPGQGESLSQMLARVNAAWQDARQCALQHGTDVLWITHAGVIRCVHWLMGHGAERQPLSHEWTAPAPAYGAWTVMPLTAEPSK